MSTGKGFSRVFLTLILKFNVYVLLDDDKYQTSSIVVEETDRNWARIGNRPVYNTSPSGL